MLSDTHCSACSALNLHLTAIYKELDTRNVASVGRCQKRNHLGDLIRRSGKSERRDFGHMRSVSSRPETSAGDQRDFLACLLV